MAAGRDEDEFAEYFRAYYHAVVAFYRRRIGDGDADVLATDVFTLAWEHWPISKERGLPWLYRTANGALLNYRRAAIRQQKLHQILTDRLGQDVTEGVAETVADREAAIRALLALAEADREILLLSSWEALTPAQIAKTLGCSTSAVYVRLYRARRRLEAIVAERTSPTGIATNSGVTL